MGCSVMGVGLSSKGRMVGGIGIQDLIFEGRHDSISRTGEAVLSLAAELLLEEAIHGWIRLMCMSHTHIQ